MQLRQLLLLTHPGLETLAAEEAAELAPGTRSAPAGPDLPGRLHVEGPTELEWRRLRLPTRVARDLGELPAGDLDAMRAALAQVEVAELEEARSFRVTAHAGEGATLDQQAAARAAGAVFHLRHGTPVDLRGFELELRLDLGEGRALLSVELHRDALDKRMKRQSALRSAIKPTIAAALVRLAGAHRGEGSLLDPTCGSGTIAVEAKAVNPALDVSASDWDEATVELARGTLANHEVDIELRQVDARELWPAWERRFDSIVFNPPYGVKVGKRARMDLLYAGILRSATEVLANEGRIVVLTPRRKALEEAGLGAGLVVREALPLTMGGLCPVAHVLEPA